MKVFIFIFQVQFNDVFGEPDHVNSLSCTWINTKKIFTVTHQKCYLVLSTIFGFPLAVLWGIKFAFTSFWTIWCCYPALVSVRHVLYHVQKIYSHFIRCCLDPFYESLGMIFNNIRVSVQAPTCQESLSKMSKIDQQ